MENSDFYEAERFLKLGLYPQAFEAFMALEAGSYECTYLMPCKMALDNRLTTAQLDLLFHDLEREVKNSNPRATYNYGLVMEHAGNQAKAIQLLQLAMDLGIPEARAALSRLLMKGG
jgi:TPR repeat protein